MDGSGEGRAARARPVAAYHASGRRGWAADALERIARLFWLKSLGLAVFMTVFFALYFHLLRHPARPPALVPATALDVWIGYQPWALWPYLSLWLYLGLAPMLMRRFADLVVYCLWNVLLCGLGLAVFFFWPTRAEALLPPDLPWPHGLLAGIDASGNACPSLHVATALFCGLWVDCLLRTIGAPRALRALQAVWLLLIVYSTLATRQHVLWDAVAGTALALAVGLPSLRLARHARYH